MEVPETTEYGEKLMSRGIETIFRDIRRRPKIMSKQEVIEHYVGAKRKAYQMAADSLVETPLNQDDVKVKAFVKSEKWDMGVKGHKPPRIIQARSPRYNITLAQYHKPVEELIYKIKQGKSQGLSQPCRVYAKTRNLTQRAADIRKIKKQFKDPVIFTVDGIKFDAHAHQKQIKQTHRLYKKLQPHPSYAKLLKHMENILGVTAGGIKFKSVGRRASGDVDTACGNSVIMVAALRGCYKELKIRKYALYDDGDDCINFMERKDFQKVFKNLPILMACIGHEVTIENITSEYRSIVFCQQRPVKLANRWTLSPDPYKVISGCFGTIHQFTLDGHAKHLRAQAQSLLSMTSYMPVLHEYAAYVLEKLGPGPMLLTTELQNEMRAKGYKNWMDASTHLPSDNDYESWEKTWGISKDLALQQMAQLRSIVDQHIPLTQPVKQTITKFMRGRPYQDEIWDTRDNYNI
jgi:hypothetical protein